jgi:hypothetical protein
MAVEDLLDNDVPTWTCRVEIQGASLQSIRVRRHASPGYTRFVPRVPFVGLPVHWGKAPEKSAEKRASLTCVTYLRCGGKVRRSGRPPFHVIKRYWEILATAVSGFFRPESPEKLSR